MQRKNKKIKVLLIIEYNIFYISEFLTKLIERKSSLFEISYIFVVKKVKKKQNINSFLKNNIFNFTILENLCLFSKLFIRVLKIFLFPNTFNIIKIIRNKKIKYLKIENILSNYKNIIKEIDPELIVNSSSLYIKKSILKMPKYGCINRHSSILPAGGGFFPIFYGITYDEPIGTSIHFMSERIDKGEVIIQKKISQRSRNDSIYDLYQKSFNDSPKLIHKAIEIILRKKEFIKYKGVNPTYRGFPQKKDWIKFREKKIRWF